MSFRVNAAAAGVFCALVLSSVFLSSHLLFAAECEESLPAAEVAVGANVLTWTADGGETLTGFYLRLSNTLAPREEPTVVRLRINGQTRTEEAAIPAFPFPLVNYTRPHTHNPEHYPPLDVAREFRAALTEPLSLQKGDRVQIEIVATGPLQSGVTAGLQFAGTHALTEMRDPFRPTRTSGPVCRIPWRMPEIIAVGTQKKFDPLCAPQNNSSIISDADGTLYQFTAYYSVDEQYGGGRGGSYSRIFGYRKPVGAQAWEPLGLIVDLLENMTYSGDPFVFRDLQGRPSLLFTNCDGTNGFADWQKIDTYLIQSKTDSFAGPWGEPTPLFRGYPREPDDNKTGGRANCVRIYPRQKQGDYLFVWNHGAQDMDIRALITPDLTTEITHEQINNGTVLVRNQEEGGGGFTLGNKGYYSTWQIPFLNDPNGVQRLYEIDLDDPLNPESWRVVPGSIGYNLGATPICDGGNTADAWAVSIVGDRLLASSCEYSASENRNYLLAHECPLEKGTAPNGASLEALFPQDGAFRWGAVKNGAFYETAPIIEYALGKNCVLEMTFRSEGELSYGFIGIGPSDQPMFHRSVALEFSPEGARLIAYRDDAHPILLTDWNRTLRWEPGKAFRMKLTRRGNRLTAEIDGKQVGDVVLEDAEMLAALGEDPRFKLYGWQGGTYEIRDAVLTDGIEADAADR